MELPLQESRSGRTIWQLRDENMEGSLGQLPPQYPPEYLPEEKALISLIQNGEIQSQETSKQVVMKDIRCFRSFVHSFIPGPVSPAVCARNRGVLERPSWKN